MAEPTQEEWSARVAALEAGLAATGEILRAMLRSPADPQPVFHAIVDSVARLTGAALAAVFRFDGELLHFVAGRSPVPGAVEVYRQLFPRPLAAGSPVARAILERRVMHIPDVETEPSILPDARERFRAGGIRSNVQVPMIRDDTAIGLIGVGRSDPGPFSDKQIELLKTFADQAVIAIENVRLFTELQARTEALTRSVAELTALGDVSRALSSSLDLDTVLQTVVARATELAGTAGCTVWEYDADREVFTLRAIHFADAGDATTSGAPDRVTTIPRGQGVTARVMASRQPVQIADIAVEGLYESPLRRSLVDAGHRALLGVPLLSDDEVIGVLAVTRKAPGAFSPEVVSLLTTFAAQSALAIRNARLFRELEVKSRELIVASEHKSEFLATMSHELRTPLNAIIGFSDVLLQGMFGDTNAKQTEYLHDILASGQHLLSLINDILDLAKIEAGRMELDLAAFDLPAAIDNALVLMRERAGRRGITLSRHVDERLGEIHADERKVKQVLLNLLSNAVKFTPEGGRIDVRAGVADRAAEISVTDTGIGIAPEHYDAVFEEFRQVGAAEHKAQGTGLGLALCRKFVELHGGRIWVKSQPGVGSTFTFALPVRS